jgi:uncharacterized membrane protein
MAYRFSLALILIGLISLMVFAFSFTYLQGDMRSLLLGASLCAIGLILRRRAARRERDQPARFRMLRRMIERDEDIEK